MDPLDADFGAALASRDEFLRQKNRRGGRSATGTRRLVRNRNGDIRQCLIEMVLRPDRANSVFREMVEAGYVQGTAEYVVAKHADLFPTEVRSQSKRRLAEYDVRT
jgi:hypothetical protein